MKSEREELIRTIQNIRRTFTPESFVNECLADFILNDRKRILEPLIKCQGLQRDTLSQVLADYAGAVGETLKLSGLLEEK